MTARPTPMSTPTTPTTPTTAPRPRRRDGLATRDLPDGTTAVLVVETGSLVVLNAPGAAVLDLSDGTRTVDEIAAVFTEIFPDVARDAVTADVHALVERLRESGLLVE
jgi:hypothetical protein